MWNRMLSVCFLSVLLAAAGQAQTASQSTPQSYREVLNSVTGASQIEATTSTKESKLTLESSDARLVESFNWAKRQAMAYVFDGDEVGPWYEAVEPGREGFCMRDTAHQSMGAHALGLAKYNLNMLRKFAENISDSKDWCSYWEIDRHNRPAPVDYKSDAEFWYNLPANFDVLDACYRMYLWTGDLTYINDPVFLNFYRRTVNDYVERWGLGLDEINRYINNVQAISTADIQKFAGRRLDAKASNIIIVGNAKAFLPELQKKYPNVEVISVTDLDLNTALLKKKKPAAE